MKRSSKSLLISIILHLTVFIILMQFPVFREEIGIKKDALSVDLFKMTPPKINRKKKPEDNSESSVKKAKEKKEPSVPKPKVTQDEPVFKLEKSSNILRTVKASKSQISRSFQSDSISKYTQYSINTSKSVKITEDSLKTERQEISEKILSSHVGDFELSGELTDASPSINRNSSQNRIRRGEGLIYYSYSNSSSSSSGGSKNEKKGEFYYMMLELANDIAQRAEKKVDVVFVIDTTASMQDNVRGIRAYTNMFFNQLKISSLDVAIGLITFSDIRTHKTEVYGVTTKVEKIRNKLFDIKFTGGSEIAESVLDALISASNEIKFRQNARKFFILFSDGTFHDADYDGQSEYSLDEVIEVMKKDNITVDVFGINYLPIKQLAYGTDGNWRLIPGKGHGEKISSLAGYKSYSSLGVLSTSQESLKDEVIVYIESNNPSDWIRLSYKLLNPLGEKCFEEQIYKEVFDTQENQIKLYPNINIEKYCTLSGTYTLIYRVENSKGENSILRRTLDLFHQ